MTAQDKVAHMLGMKCIENFLLQEQIEQKTRELSERDATVATMIETIKKYETTKQI